MLFEGGFLKFDVFIWQSNSAFVYNKFYFLKYVYVQRIKNVPIFRSKYEVQRSGTFCKEASF